MSLSLTSGARIPLHELILRSLLLLLQSGMRRQCGPELVKLGVRWILVLSLTRLLERSIWIVRMLDVRRVARWRLRLLL